MRLQNWLHQNPRNHELHGILPFRSGKSEILSGFDSTPLGIRLNLRPDVFRSGAFVADRMTPDSLRISVEDTRNLG